MNELPVSVLTFSEMEAYAERILNDNEGTRNYMGASNTSKLFRSVGGGITFTEEKRIMFSDEGIHLHLLTWDTMAKGAIDIATALGHYYLHFLPNVFSLRSGETFSFVLKNLDENKNQYEQQAYDFGLMLLIPQGRLLEGLATFDKYEDFGSLEDTFFLYPAVLKYRYNLLR